MQITITYTNEDGDELTHTLPGKHEVCPTCEGHGTHLTPSIGQHAYSMEEFYESFPEAEDRDEYFSRGGIYDIRCEECSGKRVIEVIDEERCTTDEQKCILNEYDEAEGARIRSETEDRAMCRAENGYME